MKGLMNQMTVKNMAIEHPVFISPEDTLRDTAAKMRVTKRKAALRRPFFYYTATCRA